jgi:Mrp family chromosome partitioning ATPase
MNDEERQKAFEDEAKRIADTVAHITHRIAVFSGKGGVGKTTAANSRSQLSIKP